MDGSKVTTEQETLPTAGLWVELENGETEFIKYSELDSQVLPQLLHPVGGFCYPAGAFIHLPLPSVPFYIQSWLPKRGKAYIYGMPKVGKSFLAITSARCIGSGEELLGIPTSAGRVLYLQFELGEEILQYRLKLTGHTYDNVFMGTSFSLKLDTTSGQQLLHRAIAEVEPNVVILDPFYKLLRGEENESHDVLQILDYLDACIDEFNCAFLIIHHSGKDLSKGGRGSSVLDDWVDTSIELKQVADPTLLRIKLTPKIMRHAALPPEPILATLIDYEFVLDASANISVVEQVANFLQGAETPVQVSALIGKVASRKAIYAALNQLLQSHQINKISRGVFQWIGENNDTNLQK